MRSLTSVPAPGPAPDRPSRPMTGGEVVIVVVIMILAVALLLAHQPMFGALEFVGAAAYLGCRTIKGLRDPNPPVEGT